MDLLDINSDFVGRYRNKRNIPGVRQIETRTRGISQLWLPALPELE
jgi:hypothetical protein